MNKIPNSELNLFSICAYPRSGSTYLWKLFTSKTGYVVKRHHHTINEQMVTVIRDPLDTIISYETMLYHYQQISHLEDIKRHYQTFYKSLIDSNAVIIDYDILIKSPEAVIDKICDIFNITKLNELPYWEVSDNTTSQHLKTSTKSPHYEAIKNQVSGQDLSKLYDIYNVLKERAVKI